MNEGTFNIAEHRFESSCRESKIGDEVGLYINESETHRLLQELKISSDFFVCTFCRNYEVKNKKNANIGSIYRPPNTDINIYNNEIYKLLQNNIFKKDKDIFIN